MFRRFSRWLRSMRRPFVVNIYAEGVTIAADTTVDTLCVYSGSVGFTQPNGPVPDDVARYMRDNGVVNDRRPTMLGITNPHPYGSSAPLPTTARPPRLPQGPTPEPRRASCGGPCDRPPPVRPDPLDRL